MRTRWCKVWLCSTSARSASGVVSLLGLRKTATPGTRTSGGCCPGSAARNSPNGPSLATRLRVTITWPRRQLTITSETRSPMTSGSHAPCSTFDVGAEERQLGREKQHGDGREPPRGGTPQRPGDGDEQDGVKD